MISMRHACTNARKRAREAERDEESERLQPGDGCGRCGLGKHRTRFVERQRGLLRRAVCEELTLVAWLETVGDIFMCVLGEGRLNLALQKLSDSL